MPTFHRLPSAPETHTAHREQTNKSSRSSALLKNRTSSSRCSWTLGSLQRAKPDWISVSWRIQTTSSILTASRTMSHPNGKGLTYLVSSIKVEVKKKHISDGWTFSCFAAHLIEQDLFWPSAPGARSLVNVAQWLGFSFPVVFIASSQRSRSVPKPAKQTAVKFGDHSSIRDSWPIAFSGYPRGPRVGCETRCPKHAAPN